MTIPLHLLEKSVAPQETQTLLSFSLLQFLHALLISVPLSS
jgi:hypothetical protein